MKKTKRILLYTLSAMFMSAIMLITINGLDEDSYAEVISPYESQAFSLGVSYNSESDDLILSTTNVTGYTYQYWIKEKVETDKGENSLAKKQYIWQRVSVFGSANITITDMKINYIDDNGNYNIIVRIKDSADKIVEELYRSYTTAAVGKASITNVEVNGKAVYDDYIIVNKSETLDVNVIGNSSGLTYTLFKGQTQLGSDSLTGIFSDISISSLSAGLNIITVNADTATKDINLYVYDEYVAEERPVITSLTGTSTADGVTTFIMKVKYADGSTITNANNFTYSLTSGNQKCTLAGEPPILNADGTLDVVFSVNYGAGKYGIYQTVGTVARTAINGYDDKIIIYYDGYAARTVSLTQTGEVFNASSGEYEEKYTADVNSVIRITALGSIIGVDNNNIEYAFYREDASGWVLIKNYSSTPIFTWIPARAGTYNIQVRIKDVNAGSYEKIANKIYNITSSSLLGVLSVNVYNYETKELVNGSLDAGKPYKVEAVYTGSEDILYMFTLTSENLGTVYLNKYSVSPYYMFIPGKADNYIITARAIAVSSFGYKDISTGKTIVSIIPEKITISINASLPAGVYNTNDTILLNVPDVTVTGITTYNTTVSIGISGTEERTALTLNGDNKYPYTFTQSGYYTVRYFVESGTNSNYSDYELYVNNPGVFLSAEATDGEFKNKGTPYDGWFPLYLTTGWSNSGKYSLVMFPKNGWSGYTYSTPATVGVTNKISLCINSNVNTTFSIQFLTDKATGWNTASFVAVTFPVTSGIHNYELDLNLIAQNVGFTKISNFMLRDEEYKPGTIIYLDDIVFSYTAKSINASLPAGVYNTNDTILLNEPAVTGVTTYNTTVSIGISGTEARTVLSLNGDNKYPYTFTQSGYYTVRYLVESGTYSNYSDYELYVNDPGVFLSAEGTGGEFKNKGTPYPGGCTLNQTTEWAKSGKYSLAMYDGYKGGWAGYTYSPLATVGETNKMSLWINSTVDTTFSIQFNTDKGAWAGGNIIEVPTFQVTSGIHYYEFAFNVPVNLVGFTKIEIFMVRDTLAKPGTIFYLDDIKFSLT